MEDDDFPDIPLDNFGADTNVTTPPVEEPKTAPDAPATGSDAPQDAQPVDAEDNSKATSDTDVQTPADNGKPPEGEDNQVVDESQQQGRPEKKDRVQGRFNDMSKKLSDQGSYIQKLEEQLAQAGVKSKVQPLQPDENGMLDPQVLQNHIAQQIAAQREADQALATSREARHNEVQRFEQEGQQIESKWAELREPTADNPNPDFNPKMYEAVKEAIELAALPRVGDVNSLKEVSPLKIATKIMDGYAEAQAKAAVKTQQNLEQLKADSAVDTTSTAGQPVDDMEALEARLSDVKF
jgi:hypothetical protein